MNPATYDEQVTLKSGVEARIRAIRPDDKSRILEAFNNLEPESIYTRFFTAKKTLTEDELRKLTEVDFQNNVALVVTLGPTDSETIIGAARYAAYEGSQGRRSAEVAFTVEEDYQGQGIASRLLHRLASIARRNGVICFEAEVLAENKAMLAVFNRSGLSPRQKFEDGTIHVAMPLAESES